MPTRTTKRPRDTNQLAKYIVDLSTGELSNEEQMPEREKNPAAVALGKLGASKGGQARAQSLSEAQRKEIARRAAETRWHKKAS